MNFKDFYEELKNKMFGLFNMGVEEQRLFDQPIFKFAAYIPFYVEANDPERYAYRNVMLLYADHKLDLFDAKPSDVQDFHKRIEMGFQFGEYNAEKLQQALNRASLAMLSDYKADQEKDVQDQKYNLASSSNIDELISQVSKQIEEDEELDTIYPVSEAAAGWWIK